MRPLKVLGLFSGIGGFELGLQRAGFEIAAMCEIDPFCRRVLAKHWPGVPCFNDVKTIARQRWSGSRAQTSLRRVFRARTYHTLAKVPDFPESVRVSGGKFAEPFAWYDHGSRCWRTWQRCLIEGWERYSGAWPRSGMTRNGIAYQLAELALPTGGTASGLLPTPTAREGKDWSKASILAKLDRGDGVAKKICALSPTLRSSTQIVGLNPSFAEWMMGYPTGWSAVMRQETPSRPISRNSSAKRSKKA